MRNSILVLEEFRVRSGRYLRGCNTKKVEYRLRKGGGLENVGR